ncbi:MAG: hypothetical protein ACOC56_01130 [Atribacterota bacterium]
MDTNNNHLKLYNNNLKTSGIEYPKKQLHDLEIELNDMERMLDGSIAKLVDLKIDLEEAEITIDKILDLIPKIRKYRSIIKFENAVSKYKDKLLSQGINKALLKYIINKRREDLSNKLYELDLNTIIKLEKKRGIFSNVSIDKSKIFEVFRFILPQTTDLDEIEVIVRKVKLKLDSKKKRKLNKDEVVRYFVYEADFDEKISVKNLLLNNTLSKVLAEKVVTEERLNKVLKKIKGDFNVLSNKIVSALETEILKINKVLQKDVPGTVRFFSNYVVNPMAGTASVVGFLTVLVYTISKYALEPLSIYVPSVAKIFEVTNIPLLCNSFNPQSVYIFGFALIFLGGFLKMIDDKIKKNYLKLNKIK